MGNALSILTSVHFLLHYENKNGQQFNQYNHLSPQLNWTWKYHGILGTGTKTWLD